MSVLRVAKLQGITQTNFEITVPASHKLIINGTLRANTIQNTSGVTIWNPDASGNVSVGGSITASNGTVSASILTATGRVNLPLWTTSTRPTTNLTNGIFGYNTDDNKGLEVYFNGSWQTLLESQPGTIDNPATSATSLRSQLSTPTNGAYYYTMNDGTVRQLWTDFTTYSNYSFVMVNRIWSGSQNQYLTTEENVNDLALTPTNTAPTRHSKLSDAHMNHIISANTIRWNIVGNGCVFYRLDDSPQWYSNHGAARTCSYDRGFYSGVATPSNTPSWVTSSFTYQACGGIYLNNSQWCGLSGIHTNDNTYFGGYSGSWGGRATPPSPYGGLGGSNDQWSQNGYVLLSW